MFDPFDIGAVCHTDLNDNAHEPVGQGPVDHFLFNQVVVGNDDFRIIERLNYCRTQPQAFDFTPLSFHSNIIPDLDGSLKKQDKAGYKISHDSLQTKSYSHTERTADDRDAFHFDAEYVQNQ